MLAIKVTAWYTGRMHTPNNSEVSVTLTVDQFALVTAVLATVLSMGDSSTAEGATTAESILEVMRQISRQVVETMDLEDRLGD